MSTPRSSSTGFYVIVCLALLAVCGYKVYHDGQANLFRTEYAIAVTRVIEPIYADLFSELNVHNPIDLIPRMTATRELILDKQSGANVNKRTVYGTAIKLLDGMIVAGEERAVALEALLKTSKQPRALETQRTMTSAGQVFVDAQKRRSMDALMLRKQGLDKLLVQVRREERDWNAGLPKNLLPEQYDLSHVPRSFVRVDAPMANQNSLDQKSYNQRGMSMRKRYEQYGDQGGYFRQ
jgi:hypothetical protein